MEGGRSPSFSVLLSACPCLTYRRLDETTDWGSSRPHRTNTGLSRPYSVSSSSNTGTARLILILAPARPALGRHHLPGWAHTRILIHTYLHTFTYSLVFLFH
ncbi:unnamed protein product [Protopolystoma xenopodis]|uniref:Uncharacterized protein n=1 Tax=Protopolystoma xenopodis TaxID=117903 RepID=A0A3S5BQ97_9PLAT|nr:unnamed protein product [Protopolystoma xenopodis]